MRIELIHPMLVHFPLALLLTGVALRAAAFFLRHSKFYGALLFTARLILSLGVCSAWPAVLAGAFASSVVEKNLCYPQVLEYHAALAFTAASLFTVGVICDDARIWVKKRFLNKMLMVISSLLLLVATGLLITAASLGASLVYEQGAAIEKSCSPSKN